MAYTLADKCAKNLCKRIVLLQLIIENVVTCFLEHSVVRPKYIFCIFLYLFYHYCNHYRWPIQIFIRPAAASDNARMCEEVSCFHVY